MFRRNKIFSVSLTALILAGALIVLTGCGQVAPGNGQRSGQNNNQQGNDNRQPEAVKSIDATDHFKGNLNASVQMIVYSDFECPFCADFSGSMKQVEENFNDKVAIAFRHYPLDGHSEALAAAQASECAAEQNKFWEMYDKLFADNLAGSLNVDQYKKDAGELNLDMVKFNQCLENGSYQSQIESEKAEGERAGVRGTPTIFINGNIYPGAYPFEDFTNSDGKKEEGLKSIISQLLE